MVFVGLLANATFDRHVDVNLGWSDLTLSSSGLSLSAGLSLSNEKKEFGEETSDPSEEFGAALSTFIALGVVVTKGFEPFIKSVLAVGKGGGVESVGQKGPKFPVDRLREGKGNAVNDSEEFLTDTVLMRGANLGIALGLNLVTKGCFAKVELTERRLVNVNLLDIATGA